MGHSGKVGLAVTFAAALCLLPTAARPAPAAVRRNAPTLTGSWTRALLSPGGRGLDCDVQLVTQRGSQVLLRVATLPMPGAVSPNGAVIASSAAPRSVNDRRARRWWVLRGQLSQDGQAMDGSFTAFTLDE